MVKLWLVGNQEVTLGLFTTHAQAKREADKMEEDVIVYHTYTR